MQRRAFGFCLLWFGLLLACTPQVQPQQPLGAVASTQRQATEVGAQTLRRGGNAVDAAVATALALAVVYPQAGNLGGGGFAVVRYQGAVTSLDFRETAPAAAHTTMYVDAQGDPIPNVSRIGGLAVAVPGAPSGYFELQRRYGRLPWADVVAPAVTLAESGLTVDARLAGALNWKQTLLARFPESAQRWLPNQHVPATGSTIPLDDLTKTLRIYQAEGPDGLRRVGAYDAIATQVRRHGGIMQVTDITGYQPVWRAPLEYNAFGWSFAAMDLPSSGGFLSAQTFALLEDQRWSELAPIGRAHVLVEAWRRAYADRTLLGDPRTTPVLPAQLLKQARLAARAATIHLERATPSTALAAGAQPFPADSSETTHLSVIDAWGNAVAMTVTLNSTFGSGLFVPEVGIFLNNEMDDFTTAPGHPNMFGLIQGPANQVRPGKRMLSSMTPTLAFRGRDLLAIGSPGGSRIPTATMQVLLERLVFESPLPTAVQRPRFHHQWLPDKIYVEADRFTASELAVLQAKGHVLTDAGYPVGRVNAAERIGGRFDAAADPRGAGSAAMIVQGR